MNSHNYHAIDKIRNFLLKILGYRSTHSFNIASCTDASEHFGRVEKNFSSGLDQRKPLSRSCNSSLNFITLSIAIKIQELHVTSRYESSLNGLIIDSSDDLTLCDYF